MHFSVADSAWSRWAVRASYRLVWNEETAAQMPVAAQAALLKAGVARTDLKNHSYLGRHDRVAYAVAAGRYDAGALRDTVLKRYEAGAHLKVIGRFPVPHKVWIAWEGIDDGLFETLQQALLDMTGEETLNLLPATGFAPVADQAYDAVREDIRSAERFERKP